MNNTKPYHRLPKEPEHIYNAFIAYKNLGNNRSLAQLAKYFYLINNEDKNKNLFGESLTINIEKKLYAWSVSKKFGYSWAERISAYNDDEAEKKLLAEQEQFLVLQKNSNRNTFSIAAKFVQLISTYLDNINQKPFSQIAVKDKEGNVKYYRDEPNPLIKDVRNLAATYEIAKKLERESLGLRDGQFAIFSSTNLQDNAKHDLTKLTIEEQTLLYELLNKCAIS